MAHLRMFTLSGDDEGVCVHDNMIRVSLLSLSVSRSFYALTAQLCEKDVNA